MREKSRWGVVKYRSRGWKEEKKKEGKVREEERETEEEIRKDTEGESDKKEASRDRVSLNVINMTVSGWQQG